MRTSKDVDLTKAAVISYAIDDYRADVPIWVLASHYIKVLSFYDGFYRETIDGTLITIDAKSNECFFDYEKIDPEELVCFFEGEGVNTAMRIKEITGMDLDDYIDSVTYEDGTKEELMTLTKAREQPC